MPHQVDRLHPVLFQIDDCPVDHGIDPRLLRLVPFVTLVVNRHLQREGMEPKVFVQRRPQRPDDLEIGIHPLAVGEDDPFVATAFEVECFFGQSDGQQSQGEQGGKQQAAHKHILHFSDKDNP